MALQWYLSGFGSRTNTIAAPFGRVYDHRSDKITWQRHSEAAELYLSAFWMALPSYLSGFGMNFAKFECKKQVLRLLICKNLCARASVNTLNHLRTYIFSRTFFWYQIQPISISWDAPFKHNRQSNFLRSIQYMIPNKAFEILWHSPFKECAIS